MDMWQDSQTGGEDESIFSYLPVFCCLFVDFQSERMVVSKTFCNFADASTACGFDVF